LKANGSVEDLNGYDILKKNLPNFFITIKNQVSIIPKNFFGVNELKAGEMHMRIACPVEVPADHPCP
jgi:hypothetical protein